MERKGEAGNRLYRDLSRSLLSLRRLFLLPLCLLLIPLLLRVVLALSRKLPRQESARRGAGNRQESARRRAGCQPCVCQRRRVRDCDPNIVCRFHRRVQVLSGLFVLNLPELGVLPVDASRVFVVGDVFRRLVSGSWRLQSTPREVKTTLSQTLHHGGPQAEVGKVGARECALAGLHPTCARTASNPKQEHRWFPMHTRHFLFL
jgi:hypothetical protein